MYFLIQVKFLADLALGNVDACVFTICVLVFLALLIILGGIVLLWNIHWHKDSAQTVIIKDAKNITDQHFLGYFYIFILFALNFDLAKVSMFAIFIFVTIFVGIVYVHNKLFYINPFLNILGFNFYEIKFTEENNSADSENSNQERSAKIFYRGKLTASCNPCKVKLKNEHFSFIEKPEK